MFLIWIEHPFSLQYNNFTIFVPGTSQELDTKVYDYIANTLSVSTFFNPSSVEEFDKEKHNFD
jgi:hypothetical protein